MNKLRINLGLGLALLAGLSAGCHEGLGQRCQTDADCSNGLICSKAENLCSTTNGAGSIDATPPHDAAPPDSPVDAN